MEKDENKSEVVEEKNSEATEEVAKPTPYKHPNRNLMDKEIETTATEESKEESDEKKPKEDHPVGVEDAVFKKRYDDLKRHYDETISKHKDEVLKLRKEKEAVAIKLKELGVEDKLINLKGMTQGMLVILGQKNIKKLSDFADLSSDELIGGYDEIKGKKLRIEGYLEEFNLSRKEADDLIMAAREIAYK